MDLAALRSELSFLLGFSADTPDQDFTGPADDLWRRIDGGLNAAARKEFNLAVDETGAEPLLAYLEDTWPSSQLLYTLPGGLTADMVQMMWDTTSNTRGEPIWIGDRATDAQVVWRDSTRLEWSTNGPGQDTSLLIQHLDVPRDMQNESDTPSWMPARFHDLLYWSAAISLRRAADENSPKDWRAERNELRDTFWKHLSTRRPRLTGPGSTDQPYPR